MNLRQNEPARPQLLREEQKFEDGEQFLSAVEDPIKLSVNEESEIQSRQHVIEQERKREQKINMLMNQSISSVAEDQDF